MASTSQFVETNCRVVKQQRRDRLKKVRKVPGEPMVEMAVRTWSIEKECWLVPNPKLKESKIHELTAKEQLEIIRQETERISCDELAGKEVEEIKGLPDSDARHKQQITIRFPKRRNPKDKR